MIHAPVVLQTKWSPVAKEKEAEEVDLDLRNSIGVNKKVEEEEAVVVEKKSCLAHFVEVVRQQLVVSGKPVQRLFEGWAFALESI